MQKGKSMQIDPKLSPDGLAHLLEQPPDITGVENVSTNVWKFPDDSYAIQFNYDNGVSIYVCAQGVCLMDSTEYVSWQELIKHIPYKRKGFDA
jgi:hypothetical protein